jgi:anti-anti-sigma regulatory factor/HAMP domain-containing protein
MRFTSLRIRILVLITVAALIAAGATALVVYVGGRNAIEAEAFATLTAVRENKADQVEEFFRQTCDQVVTFSEDLMMIDAMADLGAAYRTVEPPDDPTVQATHDRELTAYYANEFMPRLATTGHGEDHSIGEFIPTGERAREIQHQYIVANPFPTGEKSQLVDTGLGAPYSDAHVKYHPVIRDYAERFGYYDIFLIDPETGNIVYSVFKEVDFGTSLLAGPYRETNLAVAFRKARDSGNNNACVLEDFAPYPPSYDAPASFITSAISGPDGEVAGILAFQMPIDRINEIMTSDGRWEDVGLGASGETYIVAGDFTLRSESRFLLEDKDSYLAAITESGLPQATVDSIDVLDSAIGLQVVNTPGTRAAQQHATGTDIFDDYRDISVLSAYQPLEIQNVDWVIMSEIDEAEAFAAADEFGRQALLTFFLAAALIVIVAIWFTKQLVRPINRLSDSAAAIAEGDLDTVIDTSGSDEIGDLARSFAKMQSAVTKLIRGQERQIEALSTPLIPLRNDVLVIPVVGELDISRSAKLGTNLTTGVYDRSARVAIVDLTGTRVTDSPAEDEEALRVLNRAFQSVRLLGVQVVLTGVQAELAKRITESGIEMKGIVTEPTLQLGIDRAGRVTRGGEANEMGD